MESINSIHATINKTIALQNERKKGEQRTKENRSVNKFDSNKWCSFISSPNVYAYNKIDQMNTNDNLYHLSMKTHLNTLIHIPDPTPLWRNHLHIICMASISWKCNILMTYKHKRALKHTHSYDNWTNKWEIQIKQNVMIWSHSGYVLSISIVWRGKKWWKCIEWNILFSIGLGTKSMQYFTFSCHTNVFFEQTSF